MLRRLVLIFITIPIAIVLIALTVANRNAVPLRLDVFNPTNPALTFSAPLFVWLFGALIVGVIVGGVAMWFSQGGHRKKEREFKREADKLRYEMNSADKAKEPKGGALLLSKNA